MKKRDPQELAVEASTRRTKIACGLYIVATPIGNLRDISLRALETLAAADVIACEDTRTSGVLLSAYGINTKTTPYHEHNAPKKRPELLALLAEGKTIALISDAGTPLISDPGYKLVREAVEAGHSVFPIPGASSVMAALCASALPTDKFLFLGFLPHSTNECRTMLMPYAHVPASLVMFESARRLVDSLPVLAEALGEDREAAVARELTKRFEEVKRGTLSELATHYQKEGEPKGEIVLVIAPPLTQAASAEDVDTHLRKAIARLSLKEAVAEVAELLGLPRKQVYTRALEIKDEG